MKGWLTDLLRAYWAGFFWNTRKQWFRLRGARGIAPCQNHSDSGEAMKTGCDAALGWASAQRFHRRVCPLLRQNERGVWMCGVDAREVRPFWGRAALTYGVTVLALWLLLVAAGFGAMRFIGYRVSLRQVAWPPAWRELRGVRAELFLQQARQAYAAGDVRTAISALTTAYELDSAQYQAGLLLAQFYQTGSPQRADALYAGLMRRQPAHRPEIARLWFFSLLARGELRSVMNLASGQLAHAPAEPAAWLNALLFASGHLAGDGTAALRVLTEDNRVAPAVRQVATLALRVRQAQREQARQLLLQAPVPADFSYAQVYRLETLIQLGFPGDALDLLNQVRSEMAGRDVARLTLACYGAMKQNGLLYSEFSAFLNPVRVLHPAEFVLLAVNLVSYPDQQRLRMLCAVLPRMTGGTPEDRLSAALAVFCAAGVQADQASLQVAERYISQQLDLRPAGLKILAAAFINKAPAQRILELMPSLNPLPIELYYALLDRYLKTAPSIQAPVN